MLTLAQAHDAGLSSHAVGSRVRSGRWQRLGRAVYLASALPPDDETLLRAAVLGRSDRATASGLAAAWWHGLVDELRWRSR